MTTTLRIAWKEFRGFLTSPVAYIFLILFVGVLSTTYFLAGWLGQTFFIQPTTELDGFFKTLPVAFAILVPALAMKLWPDELKSGTVELLLSYPLKTWQVVVGKFLGGLYLVILALLCTIATPLVVSGYGTMDWGPVVGAYVGGVLMGGTFLAIGLFMGALCKEQVSAFILTAFVCGGFVFLGTRFLLVTLPREVWGMDTLKMADALSFTTRFELLGKGVMDLGDVAYFASLSVLFLVLNVTVIECRKGS